MTLSPMDCFLRHEKRLLDYGQRNSKLQDIVNYIIRYDDGRLTPPPPPKVYFA